MPALRKSQEALDLLIEDHRSIQRLFRHFERQRDDDARQDIVRAACNALRVHARLEEELFYPTVQDEIRDPDLVDEAAVEHASALQLIGQLDAMTIDDALFDATFRVLGEHIDHHFREEEQELFPEVLKTRVDLLTMGAAMTERRLQLHEQIGERQVARPT